MAVPALAARLVISKHFRGGQRSNRQGLIAAAEKPSKDASGLPLPSVIRFTFAIHLWP